MIGSEEAASLTDIPNIRPEGHSAGELADPRAGQRAARRPLPLGPQRANAIMSSWRCWGCALRRNELADLEGEDRRIRTVVIPIWVKQGINVWMTAAGIEDRRLPMVTGQSRFWANVVAMHAAAKYIDYRWLARV